MPKGGARNRSGPSADPESGRSERRGYSLTALPAEGYSGPVPDFPLPRRDVKVQRVEDGSRWMEFDEEATQAVAARERELWAWVWSTPQACAWSLASEHWRQWTVAMWVRTAVICEGSDATAADKNSLHRFADQIGMTTAGLAEMGWRVAVDEVGARRASQPASAPSKPASSRDRMKVVGG